MPILGVNNVTAYLELPYLKTIGGWESIKYAEVSLLVFLPIENTPTAVDDLLEQFSVEIIETAAKEKSQDVQIEFPKFSLEGSYALGNVSC